MTKKLIALLPTLALCGCTTLNLPTLNKQEQHLNKDTPKAHFAKLKPIQNWHIQGAFSLKNPTQNIIANYNWQHTPSAYTLNIYSSLNLASIIITGNSHMVSLKNSKGQVFRANNLSALMQETLGWQLPVNNLSYWIKGLPAPSTYKATYNQYGLLQTLNQAGFSLHFSAYQHLNGLNVPRLINIQGHNMQLRIAIKSWLINKTRKNK